MHRTCPSLTALDGLAHGFFTRKGGVSEEAFATLNCGWKSGDAVENVRENRRRIAAVLGAKPENLLTCYQIHSARIIHAAEAWDAEARPEGDAMVTDRADIALGILTADCVPVLLADPAARVIGAAHAGWRGALQGIVENTVAAMADLGARPENIIAALGPCIWQQSYEVGGEIPALFMAHDPEARHFFIPSERASHYMFDLPGLVAARLSSAGIASAAASPADTFADPEHFFSYRRNTLQQVKGTGSLMSAIMLRS